MGEGGGVGGGAKQKTFCRASMDISGTAHYKKE